MWITSVPKVGPDSVDAVTPRLAIVAAGAVLVLGLSGCAPEPAPTPTASGFTSEEEAFAAAEATYREYVKALNQVDLSDPKTFEAVYAWTTGDANAGARETFSQMHADGWRVSGETRIALAELDTSTSGEVPEMVRLSVCSDVSEVTVVGEDGMSVVSPDRPDIQAIRVTLEPVETSPTGLLIAEFDGREGEPSCGS
jgi:hypothetical protein